MAGLVKGADGNLWGTTSSGGVNGSGTIFKLNPQSGAYEIAHNFSALQYIGQEEVNADGYDPNASLALAKDSNLYGVTAGGGANGNGVIFEITAAGVFSTVYNFAAYDSLTPGSTHLAYDGNRANPDGAAPEGALIAGSDGNLYGTTNSGGANGEGTVFQFNPSTHQLVTLHNFSALSQAVTNADGARPYGGLLQVGNYFYGTGQVGGSGGPGTVFKVDANGNFTTVYNFTAFDMSQHNSDGGYPLTSLVLGPDGGVCGTTPDGGVNGYGTLFEVSPGGAFILLHAFSALSNPSAQEQGVNGDGAVPEAPLVLGSDGNFYGTTELGGANGYGGLFRITTGGVLTLLHSFGTLDANGNNIDGEEPDGGLIELSPGVFYGVTGLSNHQVGGTLYEYQAPVSAPVITSPATAPGTAQTAFSYQITATNQPTSFGAQNLPAGLSLDTSTGLISGTLGSIAGAYQISLSATNSGGTGTAVLTLTVTAAPVNAPAINSALTASGQAGQAFNYQITATNQPTSFGADNLPPGLTLDAGSGLISGTLGSDSGAFQISLSATNSGGTGTAVLTLTITPAPVIPPVISSAATASGQVGQAFNYQIVASSTPTSYSAAGLPDGLTIDVSSGLISGTPTQDGTFSVTLSAANSGGAGSATLNLTIAPALPVVSIVVPVPEVTLGSAKPGVFKVKLSAALTTQLEVTYTIKGTAINGADYLLLAGKKKFKPGVISKKIKIEPLGDLEGTAKKTVKITLSAGPGYTLGSEAAAKVKILAGP